MKKILAIVLALAMVIVPMTFSVSADAAATLTLGADTNVEAGEAIAIPVSISGDVAGAQFVVALGDLEYVGCSADAESFVYNADTNTIKFVDADLDGMTDLFTINATVPADAEAGATYALAASDLVICDIDEALIDTAVVAGTYTVAAAGPVEPVVDNAITAARAINISDTIGVQYTLNGIADTYDDFELVITRTYCDPSYNFLTADTVVSKADMTLYKGAYYALYYGVGMYELSLDISAVVKCYNGGEVVATSVVFNDTIADLAKALYSANASKTTTKATNTKIVITELLNMGAEAQAFFAAKAPSSDLAGVAMPNAGFTGTALASFNVEDLNKTNTASTNIASAVNLAGAPALQYTISKVTNPAADLTFEFSYYSDYTAQTISATVAGDDDSVTLYKSKYYYIFDKVALYDGNKTITATVKVSGAPVATQQYSIESYIYANKDNATMGNVLISIARFGKAARAYFGTV